MMERVMIIGAAIVCDWLIGDPYWLPHPIRAIGWLIRRIEKLVAGFTIQKKLQGVILWISVIGTVFFVTWGGVELLSRINPLLRVFVEFLLIYTALAARCLDVETSKVMRELEKKDISNARRFLSYLVGRDTDHLSENEIIRGAVETVAENTSDGVIAPLFYAFIGGAPLALAYKAVNTLDSMVGYKNEKYLHLGWASAKMDDWANLLPARLSAVLIPFAAFMYNKNFGVSMIIMLRDRKNHSSPNSAYPEAAVAGALQVQLGGANYYFGQLVHKPTIGDPLRPLESKMIRDTIWLMYLTEILAYILLSVICLVLA